MNETSTTIAELAKALCKAQGEMKNAPKDTVNPFFKSHYADLASCWEALRPVLSKNGLSVTQYTNVSQDGTVLVTLLLHASGEWIRGTYPIHPKDNSPQALGSAITYAKRYALQAITGLASDDDDGNAAQTAYKPINAPLTQVKTHGTAVSKEASTQPTAKQIKDMIEEGKKHNWTEGDIKKYMSQMGIEHTKDLNYFQYCDLLKKIKTVPKAGATQ